MSVLLDILSNKVSISPQKSGAISKALGYSEVEDNRPLSDGERAEAYKKNLTPSEIKRYAAGEKFDQILYYTDPAAYREEWAKDAELHEQAEIERVRTEYHERVTKDTAESAEREAVRAEKNKEWEHAANSKKLSPSLKETTGGIMPEALPKVKTPPTSKLSGSHTSSASIPGQKESI